MQIRQLRRTDGAALVAMHCRCGLATRYSRWLASSAIFPETYLRSLLDGGNEHFAVVAVPEGHPGHVVGFASAALVSDNCRELGFLVEDRYQMRGIGTVMLESLIDLLGPHEDLCVSAVADNHWLLGKLARFGTVVSGMDHGVIHARVVR
ncbi:GNAT family N-acetyltransferase [Mycobacterium sp. WUMAC-067]|uniref:GNAT family N-acetyltransferase n=1 Tax=unclassified Mycobacterium TaxID=2642494 RepID=UPI001CD96036|nr:MULTISPECIES: GNAT family N-acetyltransferase [unclassified Mycobacterium]MCA2242447.1 GNAT family N-acetyltransferase [Mycobacterium sp. WUMAC-067]MCA2313832.1 GNAT family N-acetyltransferase [Mycobacterium sp. WUMAC-025]